eukprot:SAG31_NODE_5865_length_2283_cov_4.999580_2_plen_159_part_00
MDSGINRVWAVRVERPKVKGMCRCRSEVNGSIHHSEAILDRAVQGFWTHSKPGVWPIGQRHWKRSPWFRMPGKSTEAVLRQSVIVRMGNKTERDAWMEILSAASTGGIQGFSLSFLKRFIRQNQECVNYILFMMPSYSSHLLLCFPDDFAVCFLLFLA